MTAKGGSPRNVYAQVPVTNDTAMMGAKIGSVSGSEAVRVMVQPHGVAMLRLRQRSGRIQTRDEL